MAETIISAFIDERTAYFVGEGANNMVARIEAYEESGMYCDIPYIRIHKHDGGVMEFCKHNIQGIERRSDEDV